MSFLFMEGITELIEKTVKETLKQQNKEQSLKNQIINLRNDNMQLRNNNKLLKNENSQLTDYNKQLNTRNLSIYEENRKLNEQVENLKKSRNSEPLTQNTRRKVFIRDNYRCVECGATNQETTLTIDHIIPRANGGSNDESNLQTLCVKCNADKANGAWEGNLLKIKGSQV